MTLNWLYRMIIAPENRTHLRNRLGLKDVNEWSVSSVTTLHVNWLSIARNLRRGSNAKHEPSILLLPTSRIIDSRIETCPNDKLSSILRLQTTARLEQATVIKNEVRPVCMDFTV